MASTDPVARTAREGRPPAERLRAAIANAERVLWRERVRDVLGELACTDAGETVAGVVGYVSANRSRLGQLVRERGDQLAAELGAELAGEGLRERGDIHRGRRDAGLDGGDGLVT